MGEKRDAVCTEGSQGREGEEGTEGEGKEGKEGTEGAEGTDYGTDYGKVCGAGYKLELSVDHESVENESVEHEGVLRIHMWKNVSTKVSGEW